MYKLTEGHSFFKEDDRKATLLFDSTGGFTKQAAAMEIDEYVNHIQPKEGFFYLHINAMGAGEYYGSNRNGDYFPEKNLLQYYKTFETSPAHVFRHHVNKDPSIAIGKVVFAYYNTRMHRVELIAELDKSLAASEYAAIQRGEFPLTSMACKTPFDVCSVCGNQAHNLLEYCNHLRTQINQMASNGSKVMSINSGPLSFFDISIVIRPADITSSVLQKVANETFTGSAEAAEAAGANYDKDRVSALVKKATIIKSAIDKAAELIKEIEGEVLDSREGYGQLVNVIKDVDQALIQILIRYNINDILNAFAELGMNPSMEFMSALLVSKYLGIEHIHLGPQAVEAFMSQDTISIPSEAEQLVADVSDTPAPPELLKLLVNYVEVSSYSPEMVEKRAATIVNASTDIHKYTVPVGGSYSGYTNWDTGRNSGDSMVPGVRQAPGQVSTSTLLQLLYAIAGGALLSKYAISGLTDAKINSVQPNWLKSSVERSSLMKSAGLTSKLMDVSIQLRFSEART